MIRELPEQLQVRFLPSSSCRGGTAEVTAEAIRQAPGLEPGALGLQLSCSMLCCAVLKRELLKIGFLVGGLVTRGPTLFPTALWRPDARARQAQGIRQLSGSRPLFDRQETRSI